VTCRRVVATHLLFLLSPVAVSFVAVFAGCYSVSAASVVRYVLCAQNLQRRLRHAAPRVDIGEWRACMHSETFWRRISCLRCTWCPVCVDTQYSAAAAAAAADTVRYIGDRLALHSLLVTASRFSSVFNPFLYSLIHNRCIVAFYKRGSPQAWKGVHLLPPPYKR